VFSEIGRGNSGASREEGSHYGKEGKDPRTQGPGKEMKVDIG